MAEKTWRCIHEGLTTVRESELIVKVAIACVSSSRVHLALISIAKHSHVSVLRSRCARTDVASQARDARDTSTLIPI